MLRPVNHDDVTAVDEAYARGYFEATQNRELYDCDDDHAHDKKRRPPVWVVAAIASAMMLLVSAGMWIATLQRASMHPPVYQEMRQEQDVQQDQQTSAPHVAPIEPEPAPEPPSAVLVAPPEVRVRDLPEPPALKADLEVPTVPEPIPAPSPPAPAADPEPADEPEPEPDPGLTVSVDLTPSTKERPTPLRDTLCALLPC